MAALLDPRRTEKPLLLAAIEAAAGIRPREATGVLIELTCSSDDDIVAAAHEALAMSRAWTDDEGFDYEADEGFDDDFDDEDVNAKDTPGNSA